MPSTTTATDTPVPPLASYRIPDLPPSFYYFPNFLSAFEETQILENISAGTWIQLSRRKLQVYPAQLTASNVLLSNKSLPNWLTEPIVSRFSELGVFSDSESDSKHHNNSNNDNDNHNKDKNEDKQEKGHGTPNHVLINAYEPGQGIMPHEDGPAYTPIVATVSLGAPIVLDIYRKTADGEREDTPSWRILQEERSLLVTRGREAYGGLLHGIADVEVDGELGSAADTSNDRVKVGIANWELLGDKTRFVEHGRLERKTRTSLTYRDVRKVSSLGNRLFGGRGM